MLVCVLHERPVGVGQQEVGYPAEGHPLRSVAGADPFGD